MDFVTGLPRSLQGHDNVWFVVDRLTKSMHFFLFCLSNSIEDLSIIYAHEIVRLHGVIFDRDPHFISLFSKGMQSALGSDLKLSVPFKFWRTYFGYAFLISEDHGRITYI